MTDSTHPDDLSEEIPIPLLERGDVVRLAESYNLSPSRRLASASEETGTALAAATVDPGDFPGHPDIEDLIQTPQYRELDSAPPIHSFTHGIVADIATRYPARDLNLPEARITQYQNTGGGPPRNVSLFLYNPDTGLIFLDRGPGETGRPTFVDYHVQDLTLIQKHNESYSHREIDIAAVYDLWGITDIMDTLTDEDGDEPTDPQPLITPSEAGAAAAHGDSWLSIDPTDLIESLAVEAHERLQNGSPSVFDAVYDTLDSHRIDLWRDLSFVEQMALADQLTDRYDLEDAYEAEQASEAPNGSTDWREAVLTGYYRHILRAAIMAVLDVDADDS